MKTYPVTRVAFPAGDDVEVVMEQKWNKAVEDSKKEGSTVQLPDTHASQTFTHYEVENEAEFHELVALEQERINLINRALGLKQNSIEVDLMRSVFEPAVEGQDQPFQVVEGAYDLRTAIGELTERRKATPLDKARKAIAALSPEEQAALLALFAAQNAQS